MIPAWIVTSSVCTVPAIDILLNIFFRIVSLRCELMQLGSVMLCQKSPGPGARGPQEIRCKAEIKFSIFENVASLLFVAKSKLLCLWHCVVCRCGDCEERQGPFWPVPAAPPQGRAQPLHNTSSASGEAAWRKEKAVPGSKEQGKKCEKQPHEPIVQERVEDLGVGGGDTEPEKEGVQGRWCFNLPLSLTIQIYFSWH